MADDQLSIQVQRSDETAWVTVAGEVDLATGGGLADPLFDLVAAGVTAFVINAEKITFIDSTGLNTLVRLAQTGDGFTVTVAAPSPRFRKLLQVTGLDQILSVVDESGAPPAPPTTT